MRRPLRLLLAALAAAGPAAAAQAGDLTVVVRGPGGPVADAVVTATYPGGAPPAHYAQPLRMSQNHLTFAPFVLVAPVGASVNFSNEDKVRHQVYSFSPAKTFELKLFGKDQSHSVVFGKPGTVALGCNIHDRMVAFIRVTDAPAAELTDAAGRATLHGLPGGPVAVEVWQPYLRAPGNAVSLQVVVPQTGGVEREVQASVTAPRREM